MSEFAKLGEQVGDFLRGLLQVQGRDSGQQTHAPDKKYMVVDCTETSTGTTASLDMEVDPNGWLMPLTRDVLFSGIVQFSSGVAFPLQQIIAKDYATVLSLQPAPNRLGTWNIVAAGDVQPFTQQPYEVTFKERTVSGTTVIRLSGQIFDPNSQKRVNFAVTHDPVVEIVVIAIVAGLAALFCGGLVITEASTNHCTSQGQAQCGERGVRKITLRRKYGFSWKKGGPEIGCGEDCTIECNP